jgi:carboxymethylenebutenolidase
MPKSRVTSWREFASMSTPGTSEWIDGNDGQRPLSGFLARPEGDGPWPGVVVVHDIFGITRDLHDQVEWLASAGFLAIAPP